MKCLLLISTALVLTTSTIFWYWIAHRSTFQGNWAQVKAPLLVFDFDGTICPSYPLFIDQVNFLADEYNLRKIRPEEVEDFRNMTPKRMMKTLGVSMFKLPFLLRKARHNVQKQLLELKPVPGVIEVLQELKRRQYSLGILTSNSPENVRLYLQKYKIDFFDFVYTANNVFGKEKHLKQILKKSHLNSQNDLALYVGDEVRDVDAAKNTAFRSIGVAWGYNSSTLLKGSNPDFLTEEPSQLLSIIDTVTNYQNRSD
jgi:HAD superfamily hydrolase (TIGR01549 family)